MGIRVLDMNTSCGGMVLGLLLSQYTVNYLTLAACSHDVVWALRGHDLCDNTLVDFGKPAQPIDLIIGQLNCSDMVQAEYRKGVNCQQTFNITYDIVQAICGYKPNYAVIETTEAFKSADGGAIFSYWCRALKGIGYSHRCLNIYSTGCSFIRDRYYLVAYREPESPQLKLSQHDNYYCNLADVLKDCPKSTGSKFTPKTAEIFTQVAPGHSYRRDEYRRMAWDAPAPELTLKSGKQALCHPGEVRPLTVAEVKRVLGYPDDFVITGTMREQYRKLIQSPAPAHITKVFERLSLPSLLWK